MTTAIEPATIEQTAFARLEKEKRLGNAVQKGPTHKPGRFGFRGDLGLKFAQAVADEARPPELLAEQVMAAAQAGETTFSFIAAYLHSFEYLALFAEVMGDTLSPRGKYFLFCNNVDLSTRYQVPIGNVTFYVLPIFDASVYNETLELLYLEKNDLKKLDTSGKLDAIVDKAIRFNESFPEITYEQGLKLMGPVADRSANRPV
jgi:hypothetical protein